MQVSSAFVPLLTAVQAKALDERTIEEYDVPSSLLMEVAGKSCVDELLKRFPKGKKTCVLVGPGHNGGDGMVIARYLLHAGWNVHIQLIPPPGALSGSNLSNFQRLHILKAKGYPITIAYGATFPESHTFEIIIDALLGIGTNRNPEGALADAIQWANAQEVFTVSVDLPSGLDASSGIVYSPCIKADLSLQIGSHKNGLYTNGGFEVRGELVTCDIGFPMMELKSHPHWLVQHEHIKAFPTLKRLHKYADGTAYIIGGSKAYSGAVILAAQAAWNRGLGAVKVIVPACIAREVRSACPNVVVHALSGETEVICLEHLEEIQSILAQKKGIVLLGPGMARNPQSTPFTEGFLKVCSYPCVIDADGLWHLAKLPTPLTLPEKTILTPHLGELQTLSSHSDFADSFEGMSSVHQLIATKLSCYVISKGNPTQLGSPDGTHYTLDYPSYPFARFGFGDVLAGRLAADVLQYGCTPKTILQSLCTAYKEVKPLLSSSIDPFELTT